jgi:hypothetical protein
MPFLVDFHQHRLDPIALGCDGEVALIIIAVRGPVVSSYNLLDLVKKGEIDKSGRRPCRRPGLKGYGAYVIWVYQDHTST